MIAYSESYCTEEAIAAAAKCILTVLNETDTGRRQFLSNDGSAEDAVAKRLGFSGDEIDAVLHGYSFHAAIWQLSEQGCVVVNGQSENADDGGCDIDVSITDAGRDALANWGRLTFKSCRP